MQDPRLGQTAYCPETDLTGVVTDVRQAGEEEIITIKMPSGLECTSLAEDFDILDQEES